MTKPNAYNANHVYSPHMLANTHGTAVFKPETSEFFDVPNSHQRRHPSVHSPHRYSETLIITSQDSTAGYIKPWEEFANSDELARWRKHCWLLRLGQRLAIVLWIIGMAGILAVTILNNWNVAVAFTGMGLSIVVIIAFFWKTSQLASRLEQRLQHKTNALLGDALVIDEYSMCDKKGTLMPLELVLEDITPPIRDGILDLARQDHSLATKAVHTLLTRRFEITHQQRLEQQRSHDEHRTELIAAALRSPTLPDPSKEATMADTPSTHSITLNFEDAETLAQALEYLGNSDAPVMLTSGSITTGDKTFELWDGYEQARDDLQF